MKQIFIISLSGFVVILFASFIGDNKLPNKEAELGKKLFFEKILSKDSSVSCASCHKLGGVGNDVGPDLASVGDKSVDGLLTAILDPNREAQPNFQTYTALTKQGTIFTGIISAETAASLTLKRAEAKEDVVLRDTLDELLSNGVSLMPEGLEKDIDPQQLADIIAALKSGP